jgi:predicted exporter
VRSALLHTTTHVAVGNLTAAMTLALAFFAATFADFQAVAELGWIAGCGVLLCALACFTVLPALLMLFDRRQGSVAATIPLSTEAGWLPRLSRQPRWIVGTGLGLTAVAALFALWLPYDHNLLHLQARGLDAVKWELTLIEHTAGASWHALSIADTPKEALELKERFEKLPEVSQVVEVASLVPPDQSDKIELLGDIRHRLRHLPERGALIHHPRPSNREVRTELACLVGQLQPLADASNHPLLQELRRGLQGLQDQIGDMPSAEVSDERLQEFEERLSGDLAEDLHRLRNVSAPTPILLEDLPADFRARYVSPSGKWVLEIFAKDCLWDFAPLENFTRRVQSIDPKATGKPFTTVEGLRAMKSGFQWAGFWAFMVIVIVLFADFRGLYNTLIALTPLVMGIVLSLGIMAGLRLLLGLLLDHANEALCGLSLNPANMIALPLILGVGVDNGVHVLHDYLLRRAEGKFTISYPIGRGVLVKALTTMIGFGTLMISSERGLASLGFILTLGVGCCMLTALVFLPAVLKVLGTSSPQEEETILELPMKRVAG